MYVAVIEYIVMEEYRSMCRNIVRTCMSLCGLFSVNIFVCVVYIRTWYSVECDV